MNADASLHDREALRTHLAAVHSFQAVAGDVQRSSLGTLQKSLAEVEQTFDRCAERRVRAQRGLESARRAAASCHADPRASCSREDAAVEDAVDELREAEQDLAAARRCRARLQAAASRFRQQSTTFMREVEREAAAAASFLRALTSAADAYVGGSVTSPGSHFAAGGGGGGGAGGGSGGATAGAVGTDLPRIDGTDLFEAPLDRIDTGDGGVTGPGDFGKTEYGTMRDGVQRLDEVVLPAVRGGSDGERFSELDRSRGLDYEHGYRRVYDAFFGLDSVRLDAREDGSFGVTDGRHRVHVARELGLRSLPARIAWRRGRR